MLDWLLLSVIVCLFLRYDVFSGQEATHLNEGSLADTASHVVLLVLLRQMLIHRNHLLLAVDYVVILVALLDYRKLALEWVQHIKLFLLIVEELDPFVYFLLSHIDRVVEIAWHIARNASRESLLLRVQALINHGGRIIGRHGQRSLIGPLQLIILQNVLIGIRNKAEFEILNGLN